MKTTDAGDADVLAQTESELRFMNSMGRSKAPRIKIPKGHTWRLRFIPFKFPNGMYYARIAFHWINNRPTLCLANTEERLGGIREFDCPICRVASELNNSSDKKLSNAGYWASSNPQWLAMALPFAKDDGGGEENTRGDERWTAAEFWMHKATALDFINIYRRDVQRLGPESFMHFEKGRDIWVTVRQKSGGGGGGMKLDRDDAQPFFRLDDREKFDEMCERVLASVRWKMNDIPTDDELEEVAEKLEESARRPSSRRGDNDEDDRRGGGRRRNADDTDLDSPRSRRGSDDDDRGGRSRMDDDRRTSRDRDDRGGVSRSRDDDQPRGRRSVDDDRGGDDRGGRRGSSDDLGGRDDDDRGDRRSTRGEERGRREEVRDDPPARPPRGEEDFHPVPPAARSHASPPPAAARRASPPPAASKQEPPPARSTGPAQSSLDPDDNVPEESRDPAPPAEALPEGSDDNGGAQEEPPPVRTGLSDRLRNSIRRASA